MSVSAGFERQREETESRHAESRAVTLKLKAQVEQAAAQLERDKKAFEQKQVCNSSLSWYLEVTLQALQ